MGQAPGAREGAGPVLGGGEVAGCYSQPPRRPAVPRDRTVHNQDIQEQGNVLGQEAKWTPASPWKEVCLHLFPVCNNIIFIVFRFQNALKRLAGANPFWGALRLQETVRQDILDAMNNRPPGAVFQVCVLHLCFYFTVFISKVPTQLVKTALVALLNKMGMRSLRSSKKPFLTKMHFKKRKDFARKFQRWSVDQWRKVTFSDEKIFRARPGGLVRCWVQKGANKYSAKYVTPVQQKPIGLMVWAAMDGKGNICLRRCPPKLNAVAYQDILATALSFIKKRCVQTCFLLPPSFICTEVPQEHFSKTVHQCTRQGVPRPG